MLERFQRQQTGRTSLQIVSDHLFSWEKMLEGEQTEFSPTETEAEQAYLNHLRSEFKRLSNTQDQVKP